MSWFIVYIAWFITVKKTLSIIELILTTNKDCDKI